MNRELASAGEMIRFGEWAAFELPKERPAIPAGAHTMNTERFLRKYGILLIAAAAFTIYTLLLSAYVAARTEKAVSERLEGEYQGKLMAWQQELNREREEQEAAARITENITQREAEALARVLYGVKDNSTDDLRTYAWCVLNRADNPAYPGTIEEVIAQPQQWMAYSADNPVLENLYQIAYEEIRLWQSGAHRPVSDEYVYMTWSPSDIVLRDTWKDGSGAHYWRDSA